MENAYENKRDVDDEDDKPRKKQKGGYILIRLLVPNKIVGGIIGKGGENIKALRLVCQEATIKVKETPDCPNAEERIVHVECNSDDVYAIFSQLVPQIFDGLQKNGYDSVKEPEVCTLFSGTTMGSLIGKGGAVINNLRQTTGAFMKAFPNKLQNSDERVLLLRGSTDNIINCLVEIYGTVEMDNKPYRMFNPVDSLNIPREAGTGGYQGGELNYESGGGRRDQGAGRPRGPMTSSFGPAPPFRKAGGDFYSSPYGQGAPDSFGYNSAAPDFYPSAPYQPHDSSGFGGFDENGSGGGLLAKFIMKFPFTQYAGTDGEAPAIKEVTLENNLTGCVIGDKGSRIRDVRSSSGAKIKIGDFDTAGPGERLITIEGTNEQCHLAEYMLQCCVQTFSLHGQQASKPPQRERKKLTVNSTGGAPYNQTNYAGWAAPTNMDNSANPGMNQW